MMTVTLNPTQVDTVRAVLDHALASADAACDHALRTLAALLKGKNLRGQTTALAAARAYLAADPEPQDHLTRGLDLQLSKYQKAHDQLLRAQGAIQSLDAVFAAAGGWARFWIVPGGHVHGDAYCPTLHREGKRTTLNWVPDLAGHTETEAVAEFGELMCTVCFPSAPADPAFNGPGRRAQADLDAKLAEKNARAAARAAKAITNADGTPLIIRSGGSRHTIETLASAQQALRDEMWKVHFYGALYPDKSRSEEHANIETLLAAIAAKTGRDAEELRAEFDTKARKKATADLK